jgi:hypothetical protein
MQVKYLTYNFQRIRGRLKPRMEKQNKHHYAIKQLS